MAHILLLNTQNGNPDNTFSSYPSFQTKGGINLGKKSILVVLIITLLNVGCDREKKDSSIKTKFVDGRELVYNTIEPAKGVLSLEVNELVRIDPFAVDQEDPPLFQTAAKDDKGNLYLADSRNVKAFKFDSRGRLVARFLNKGQGPGEFPRFGDLQIAHNHVWIIGNWPMKIAQYTLDGQYVNEWMFRTFRNFYLRTKVINEDRFLAVSYQEGPEGRDRTRVSTLINSREEFLTQYYTDPDAGIFRIQTEQLEGPAIASTNPLIAADIHHAYDPDRGIVFVCNNREYKIQLKNTDGTTRMIIHKAHKNITLDEEKKEKILQLIAPQIPIEAKKPAMEQLPDSLNTIWGLAVLPHGNLAVRRITGMESIEIDVFDSEGRFIYTILPSVEIPDLRNLIFFKDSVGYISETDAKNVFIEYRVKNLKGIFD